MRIPVTMCHGIRPESGRNSDGLSFKPLTVEHLDRLMRIVSELGFESITYDDLAEWHDGSGGLPERPIMLDFDHPIRNIRYEVRDTRYACPARFRRQPVHVHPPLRRCL